MALFRRDQAPAGVAPAVEAGSTVPLPLPADQPGREPQSGQEPQSGREPQPGRVARFAREHALFAVLLLAAAVVRAIAILGFRGPMVTPDSADYVANALRMTPGLIRPSGYPAMLRLLEPFHSLAGVTVLQHLMGLVIGVAGYALLRRLGLPGWGATLAMVPVLLSAYAIQMEHFLLSDTLFTFLLMMAVVAMLWWWPDPPVWACGLTGLLLAAATLVRSQGLPLLIIFLVTLLVRLAGWRTITRVLVMCAAFAIPVAGYAAWFDSAHGKFALTSSQGAFLYAAVAPFADCAKIKPAPPERALCLTTPVSERHYSQLYIWDLDSPIRAIPGGEFGKLADRLGTKFALRAIRAQPVDYLRLTSRTFWESFLPHRDAQARGQLQRVGSQLQLDNMFPAAPPTLPRYATRYYFRYDLARPVMWVVKPYASWIRAYQRYIVVAGPLLGVILLVGLGGLIVAWRRIGGPALLPWLTGLALLVAPAAVADFSPRYLVCALPPLCVAAAIGVQQIARRAKPSRDEGSQPAL